MSYDKAALVKYRLEKRMTAWKKLRNRILCIFVKTQK